MNHEEKMEILAASQILATLSLTYSQLALNQDMLLTSRENWRKDAASMANQSEKVLRLMAIEAVNEESFS